MLELCRARRGPSGLARGPSRTWVGVGPPSSSLCAQLHEELTGPTDTRYTTESSTAVQTAPTASTPLPTGIAFDRDRTAEGQLHQQDARRKGKSHLVCVEDGEPAPNGSRIGEVHSRVLYARRNHDITALSAPYTPRPQAMSSSPGLHSACCERASREPETDSRVV